MATLNDLEPQGFMQEQMVEIAKIAHYYGQKAAPHFDNDSGVDVMIFMIIRINKRYQGAIVPGNMFFSNPMFHDNRRAMLRTVFAELKVPVYGMVMEGWSVDASTEAAIERAMEVAPREHPDRKSSLVICCESREGDHLLASYTMSEDRVVGDEANGMLLSNTKEKDSGTYHDGAMVGLLEPISREESERMGILAPLMKSAIKSIIADFKQQK